MSPRRASIAFGAANLLTAALVSLGVFVALPARWLPVDLAAAALVALQAAAGVGLVADARWGKRVGRAAAAVALVLGLAAVTLLAVAASWLSGVYGPVGRGGAIVLVLCAALALAYLVALPAGELLWLRT